MTDRTRRAFIIKVELEWNTDDTEMEYIIEDLLTLVSAMDDPEGTIGDANIRVLHASLTGDGPRNSEIKLGQEVDHIIREAEANGETR